MSARLKVAAQAAAVAVVAALLGLLVWKVAKGEDGGAASALARGERPAAPAFTLPRLDGRGDLTLASFAGKPVVVNFWASWCLPCAEEAGILEDGHRRWKGKGVAFLGIDAQDFRGDARAFVREHELTYPNVYDGKGSTLGRFGLTGFPETFFLDARGRIVSRIAGPIADAEELDEHVRRALSAS